MLTRDPRAHGIVRPSDQPFAHPGWDELRLHPRSPTPGAAFPRTAPSTGPEIVLKKQSGAAKRGSRTLSLHRDGNAADRRRHFGTHLRAAELQDNAFRILQLNAAGTACDGTTRTGRCVAACKVAGAVEI